MAQKRDGEDQLERSVKNEEAICIAKKESNIVHKRKRRKNIYIGRILRRDYTKIEGRIKVMGRRGRRRKELLDGLKEMRIYCKLKEETLDRPLWGTRFRRVYGPVVRKMT